MTAGLLNGGQMKPTKAWKLALPQLPEKNQEGQISSGLTYRSLIPIINMCDIGWKAVFTKTNVHIIKIGQQILTATRYTTTGLWGLPWEKRGKNKKPKESYIMNQQCIPNGKPDGLSEIPTNSRFSPVNSAWIKAIQKGYFQSWPGLTVQVVKNISQTVWKPQGGT